MANWCINTVVFEGTSEAIEQIDQLFRAMAEQGQREGCGQMPEFLQELSSGFFFTITCNEQHKGAFEYHTKWMPNTEVLRHIAAHFDVSFTQAYDELACGIFGRATLLEGKLDDTRLEGSDFGNYHWDGQSGTYQFEGNEYECEWDILQTLLERKIKRKKNH